MAIEVTEQKKIELEAAGYGLNGYIGGLPRKTYYTPDGRVIKAIPSVREYVLKRDGKVIEKGVRDANLDKGWLETKPAVLKPYCKGCDRWHDTEAEIAGCIMHTKAFIDSEEAKAKKQEVDEMDDLRTEIAELRELVKKLGVK